MPRIVHEGLLEATFEDSRMAMICEIIDDTQGNEFFRVQSWDTTKQHAGLAEFVGQRVRITIETLS